MNSEKRHIPTKDPERRPLVATLEIEPSTQQYFNQLRRQHFPAERNYLNAHLTLFHALPHEPWIIEDLRELAKDQTPFEATAQTIISLGGGTAFKISSAELPAFHQKLRERWFEFLSRQDQQKRNFHITVQNKVDPQLAKKLQSELAQTFKPFSFIVTGFQLWRYLGGPWEYVMTISFEGNAPENLLL
ncbi:2'-5' RNA ligase family protein [Dyadobacter fanqingshengii]|uniref:2'-5' RNA ligase family protein n=1 Tax=Dyadobacter fanqingshengii TaxID=2906443 RepID=A0A9X1PBD5_9BACT|nr:2'-5' RNA ligase family protein [Dyadobacter fanqingshengii]MCF0041455.1 2'-5' RNA ligase family protein [Dyadobacter fanqingshengii]USJ36826.1 2'-5' RNA ligase family protein [Dyadobacter fanqingshengii]